MTDIFITYIVPVIHVLACLLLIVVVLLQTGKGADMGAVFGGGSQTLFGSGGAGNFLTKLTTGTAIAFMVTSLILSYGSTRPPSSDLLRRLPAPTADSEPLAGMAEEEATPGEAAPAGEAPGEGTAPAAEATPPAAEGEAPAAPPQGQ
jgi:preprotein translocase subunit SecG